MGELNFKWDNDYKGDRYSLKILDGKKNVPVGEIVLHHNTGKTVEWSWQFAGDHNRSFGKEHLASEHLSLEEVKAETEEFFKDELCKEAESAKKWYETLSSLAAWAAEGDDVKTYKKLCAEKVMYRMDPNSKTTYAVRPSPNEIDIVLYEISIDELEKNIKGMSALQPDLQMRWGLCFDGASFETCEKGKKRYEKVMQQIANRQFVSCPPNANPVNFIAALARVSKAHGTDPVDAVYDLLYSLRAEDLEAADENGILTIYDEDSIWKGTDAYEFLLNKMLIITSELRTVDGMECKEEILDPVVQLALEAGARIDLYVDIANKVDKNI